MNPPVNALSRPLAAALREAWASVEEEKVILTGRGKMFVAGADIREIEQITRRELAPDLSYLNELLHLIERSGKLVVMAMNGGALGIGLELAMAGHYRILDSRASVGLPEVKLGLIPGAGGTQRLPRLIGVEAAMRLCATGEIITASEALELGLVDELADGDWIEKALAVAQGRRTDSLPCQGVADWEAALHGTPARQHSPKRAIEAIRAAAKAVDFDDGLAEEARLFREALLDRQARAMVHLFFAERELSKVPMVSKDVMAAQIESINTEGDEIELRAAGVCRLKTSPAAFGGRVLEIQHHPEMQPQTLAAALQYAREQGKLAVVTMGGNWIGRVDLDGNEAAKIVEEGRVLRGGDLDVLMVRGYGYPEERGGPVFAYSTTPNQISESAREPLK